MRVINRSDGNVTYRLDELNVRRVFTPNEYKDVPELELNSLYQTDGGKELIKHHLLVEDEKWVSERWDAPLEYFWTYKDIERCLKEDSLELFEETLDYAPHGVLDLIKTISWKMPLTDLNKIEVIRRKLGFDVQAAVSIMTKGGEQNKEPQVRKKRIREERLNDSTTDSL